MSSSSGEWREDTPLLHRPHNPPAIPPHEYRLPRRESGSETQQVLLGQVEAAGLNSGLQRQSIAIKWNTWRAEQIQGDTLVTPLMIITFSCAASDRRSRVRAEKERLDLADAITLQRYSTFATSMTGNTVLLAVRIMGTTDKPPLMAGVSLAGFIVAGLLFGQMGGIAGHRRRDWLLFSFSSQAAVLAANAVLVAPGMSKLYQPEGELGWIYLLLLAIQGGIQVTQAANSGAREIPSAMMTTPYAALISDPALFASASHADVRSRNRRIVYIVVFWSGAFFGAGLSLRTNIFIATLAVLLCKIIAIVWLLFATGSTSEESIR